MLVHKDEPTENYHPTLQFSSALWSVLASFNSLFWFSGSQLTVLVQSHHSHQANLHMQQAAVFLTNPLYTTAKGQTVRQS